MIRRALALAVAPLAALITGALTGVACVDVPAFACGGDGDCASDAACSAGICVARAGAAPARDAGERDGREGDGGGDGGDDAGALEDAGGAGDAGPVDAGELAPPTSCADVLAADPAAASGTYEIDVDGAAASVTCDMQTAGGGWTLAARFAEGDACPGAWLPAFRGCGRGTLEEVSASFAAPHPYREVRGLVRVLQSGGPDGFRDNAGGLEGRYFDGVSITTGAPGARRHLFSFAMGVGDAFSAQGSECPCSGGPAPPAFVGAAYRCEEARNTLVNNARVFDEVDVLFDGVDIDDPACQGVAESLPDFEAAAVDAAPDAALDAGPAAEEATTRAPLEVRIMQSQAPGDEDAVVIALELWVR